MKRILLFTFLFAIGTPFVATAQFEKLKDSVVQLFGVVMTADSLQGIPSVSVVVRGQNRGTMTNEQGVFFHCGYEGRPDRVQFNWLQTKTG